MNIAAPPAELLGALVERRSLPPVTATRYPMLVAPGLAYLWRPASADESRLFTRCQTAPSVEDLLASVRDLAPTLRRMVSACVLQSDL